MTNRDDFIYYGIGIWDILYKLDISRMNIQDIYAYAAFLDQYYRDLEEWHQQEMHNIYR